MEKTYFGIPAEKLINLLASLACAAVGMIFINMSLNSFILTTGRNLFMMGSSPVQYSFIGFGFVFLVMSVFFIYEAFKGGFFNPESLRKDGLLFCVAMVLIWLVLYCLDFILLIIMKILIAPFGTGS
jgi:hypothetical protein